MFYKPGRFGKFMVIFLGFIEIDTPLRIRHNVSRSWRILTGQKPLERARSQFSNGFCLVEKDLISRKLWHILDSAKIRQELFRIILH